MKKSDMQAQAPKSNRSIWNLWGLFGTSSATTTITPGIAANAKAKAPTNVVEAEEVDGIDQDGVIVGQEIDVKAEEEAYENQVVQHYWNEEQDQKAVVERIRAEARKEAEQRAEQAFKEAEQKAQQAFNARLQDLEARLKAQEEENIRLKAEELQQKEKETRQKAEESAKELERKNQEEARQRQEEARQRQEEENRRFREEALRKEQLAFEEKQKQEQARLKQIETELKEREARILAQVKETAQKLSAEIEEKNRVEDKILRERMEAQKANNACPNDALDTEILEAVERRKGRRALLAALQAIVNDPKTIVKPKPAIDKHIYPEHAPFTDKEQWVHKLPTVYVPTLNETVQAVIDLNDPFNAKFEDLMKALKLSAEEMAKLQLEIEVHDLDNEFGMATRRKRVLNGQCLLPAQQGRQAGLSHREEGEIMFGAKKGQQAVVLKFDSVERGSYRIREVTAENIRDFQENIVENQGIVVKGKKEGDGTTLYNTTRKRKAAVHI